MSSPSLSLSKFSTVALLLSACIATSISTLAQDRLPPIPPSKYTPEQQKAAAEFLASRGVPVFGPFSPLMRSPEVMLRAMAMGNYLKYKPALPGKLREMVILITSRQWTQRYEWSDHVAFAQKEGLSSDIIRAIAEGRRPAKMTDEEEIVHDFCIELHHNKSISDALYQRAVTRFGEQGVVDLASINGYYTFLAMVMNTARTAVPKATDPDLKPIP